MRRFVRAVLVLAVAGLLLTAAWFTKEYHIARPGLARGAFFEVEKGQGVGTIARNLAGSGLIRSPLAFRLAYRLSYSGRSLKAGEYAFPGPVTMKDILEAMTKGKVYLQPVTVPEGLTGAETAEEFARAGLATRDAFLEAFADRSLVADWDPEAPNAEGYLFPETYRFPRRTSARQFVARMIGQFESVFGEAWRLRARELGLTLRQVTTLASLIEKETSRPEEKKLVSAVFHNRLRLGMKLDCDPTVIYALKLEGKYEGRLLSRDLKFASPYNTYLHSGLPPGPIANPGRDSLEAALYPAEDDSLYFVARGDGSHHFSRTFREHQRAVNEYHKAGH
jgi:UPF0755 protein